MKENPAPKTIYLKDYQAPAFDIDTVDLRFDLGEETTRVRAMLAMRRTVHSAKRQPLRLDGHKLSLQSLLLDGRPLKDSEYEVDEVSLTIHKVPDVFLLEIETELKPQENTELEGLYRSNGTFCTQCEAEGFRRITYFLDRPDVLARYSVKIVADKKRYPVLLSNGNLINAKTKKDGRHYVRWEDPHPKPCYLFALVAGDLSLVEDQFVTRSGREVALRIYTEPHNKDKCAHAMRALKNSMAWDENVYGLEYDLDIYMIVAVDDFNMGAMENKGLNVFNSKLVFADQATATDLDFQRIESVIGHEYFHNWTGNRVTCRDWFQLSLKEGLTVFRDQEFSADLNSRSVKRIEDVRMLRERQFPEDAGPMAHPVRPASYIEINNFYTLTVYEKGSEVIRMMHTLLGAKRFHRGIDLYFQRHDGCAVTCDDFVAAMEDASGESLEQFKRWYAYAGTPTLTVSDEYDAEQKVYRLTTRQHCPDTPGQSNKPALHIPLRMGLLDKKGRAMALHLPDAEDEELFECVLSVTEVEQTFEFHHVPSRPIPSLLRGFSAPVKLSYDYDDAALAFLIAHDSDAFNRWEAAQDLATRRIEGLVQQLRQGEPLSVPTDLEQAFATLLADDEVDPAWLAEALALPSLEALGERHEIIDIDNLHTARQWLRVHLATALESAFLVRFGAMKEEGEFSVEAESIGRRALHNVCLDYLCQIEGGKHWPLLSQQLETANNMTDTMAALTLLNNTQATDREAQLQAFYDKWRHERLVLDKWFVVQATSTRDDTLKTVAKLLGHPDFEDTNPNRVRALVGAFAMLNPVSFHDVSGRGYRLLSDFVIHLDGINPQVAARLVSPLSRWRRYDDARQKLMCEALQQIVDKPDLSRDVYEIVSKSLESA